MTRSYVTHTLQLNEKFSVSNHNNFLRTTNVFDEPLILVFRNKRVKHYDHKSMLIMFEYKNVIFIDPSISCN